LFVFLQRYATIVKNKGKTKMFEYLKRKFFRLSGNVQIDTYPQYYEENGRLVREESDGTRYVVVVDEKHGEKIVGVCGHGE